MSKKTWTWKRAHSTRHSQNAVTIFLTLLLLLSNFTPFVAPPVYAASDAKNHNLFKRIMDKIFPPVISPIPATERKVLGEEVDIITPRAPILDLDELEIRIAALEKQVSFGASRNISSTASSFATGTNLIRNSSFENSRGDKPRQWNYIYGSTMDNTKQTKEAIRSGNYGLKFQGSTSSSGNGIDLGISQPETETTPQRSYTLSLYVKHTNVNNDTDVRNSTSSSPNPTTATGTTPTAYIRLGFWDKYNNTVGPMKTVSLTGTKDWYRLSTTVETTGTITDYANWYPMLEVRGLKEDAAVYMDDVQLEEGSVLTLYNSAQATGGAFGSALGDGSILATATGTLYPAGDGVGSLGTTSHRFRDLYLSKATVNENGDLNLDGDATVGDDLTVNDSTNLKGNITLGDSSSDTVTVTGTATFSGSPLLTGGINVGTDGAFTINSSGNITKLRGVSYSFPSTQGGANEILINDGSGTLSWGTFGAASVTADSLDFAQFLDAMTVDADTRINLYNSGATDLRFYNSNASYELLFLDGSTGRIGIGTTAPSYSLDVAGNINIASGSTLKIAGTDVLSATTLGSGVVTSALTTVGALNSGSITSGFGSIDVGTDTITTSGAISGGTLTDGTTTFADTAWTSTGALSWDLANASTSALNIESGLLTLDTQNSRVGIGTTSPGSPLVVNGEARLGQTSATGRQIFIGNESGWEDAIHLVHPSGGAVRIWNGSIGSYASTLNVKTVYSNTGGNVGLTLQGNSTVSGGTTAIILANSTVLNSSDTYLDAFGSMYIKGSGNVGVGTASPAGLFDVNGKLTVLSGGNVGIGTTSPDSSTGLSVRRGDVSNFSLGEAQISFEAGPAFNDYGYRHFIKTSHAGSGNANGNKMIFALNQGIQSATPTSGIANVLTLVGSTRAGIGNTNPQYALDVNGDINTTGDIRKNGTAYTNPDYVFESDYNLMSLSDLKNYVATNKHLPGVPSSEDVKRDGVKLFEQTRLNLEKTEEAYLYLFDLDNRLNTLSLSLPQHPPEATTLAVAGDTDLDTTALEEELAAVKDQMLSLEERLAFKEDESKETASMSAALASLKADVEILKNAQTVASVSVHLTQTDVPITTDEDETVLKDVVVSGEANIFNLAVLDHITTGLLTLDGLSCTDGEDCVASIATLNGTLALQPEATGPLEIMAGKIVIDTNGDMKLDGKITVNEVEAESVDLKNDVVMKSGITPPTGACQTGTMYVYNDKKADEARMFVCSKKSWQEITTEISEVVSKEVSPTPTAIPQPTTTSSPTPTPPDVPQNSPIPPVY